MSPLWLSKARNAKKADVEEHGGVEDRRSGKDRRTGRDRRDGHRQHGTRELYQSDLDRHLWSWTSPAAKKRRKARGKRKRRRRFAGVVASAAGALSAAGLSYFLYKRLREDQLPADPEDDER